MLAVSLLSFQFRNEMKTDLWLNSWFRPMDSFLLAERYKMCDYAL